MLHRVSNTLHFPRCLLLAWCLLLTVALAETSVRGVLSTTSARVGEAVEYELTISGSDAPSNPPAPNVDGMELRGTSTSKQLSFVNGNVSNRLILTYTLVPKREGKFTIPELEVKVGGQILKTLPATLTVGPGENLQEGGDLAFAKIVLPKKTLYVGEVVPMEVRLYLDASARWDLRSMPTLNGDGFTTRPFGKPTEKNTVLADKSYHLVTFNTLITPGRAGKISIGPVPVGLTMSKPARNQRRFDIFGQTFASAQEMIISAPENDIQVVPLPVEGRPKDFSGAIGKFEFNVTTTPDRVKIGEPLSVKMEIRGSGNFDRIGQPPLAEPQGWTIYSPKEKFDGSETGTEGVKTFELPVTPTITQTTKPIFAFSYFDPEAGKYAVLQNAGEPLIVEGAPVAAGRTPTPGPAAPQTPANDKPKPPVAEDILANLPDIGRLSASFGPPLSPAAFFSALIAPVPVAVALLVWRRRRSDATIARLAGLKRERVTFLSKVRTSASRAEVLDAAVKVLSIDVQIAEGSAPVDSADELIANRKIPDGTEKALREIFNARAELLYAGASGSADAVSTSERDGVLNAITDFERSLGK